jgi:hypothetical protein
VGVWKTREYLGKPNRDPICQSVEEEVLLGILFTLLFWSEINRWEFAVVRPQFMILVPAGTSHDPPIEGPRIVIQGPYH